ncbi:hypothetical protein OG760_11015 [Streptomyces sp. NBC_00963]|uniref:hypothetical protein n=1 Tax=Streptomyces sp. NBC_00963 TaxID=2903697 RepID=UPI003869EAD5|nr:hypothetical protein OG760_11015 [Streptomyces sp. NBC_00963]
MSTAVRMQSPASTAAAPCRAPRPWAAELRRGLAPWAAVATFLALLVPLAGKAAFWQGSWAQTEYELHTVTMLLGGPLAAAAGCWQGGREHRRGTAELRASASRGPLAQFLTASLPVAAGPAAGSLAASAAALLASWPYTSAGGPQLSVNLADALCLVALALVGHTAGRAVRWRLAAPLVAVCALVVLGAPSYQEEARARFLDPALQYGTGDDLPVWWQPYAMTLWICGLAAAVVLLCTARRRARRLALLPLAAACAAAVLMVQSGSSMWREDPAARRETCAGTALRICITAVHRDLLPQVTAALGGIAGRLEEVPNAPARLDDLAGPARPDDRTLPEFFLGQSVVRGRLADPEQFAWEVGAKLAYGSCEIGDGDDRLLRTGSAVQDWLISSSLSERRRAAWESVSRRQGRAADVARNKKDRAALDRLTAMEPGARRAWLGRYFAAVRGTCHRNEVPAL